MKLIIVGDKGSGKSTLARIILKDKEWVTYLPNLKEVLSVRQKWVLFADNVTIDQEFIDVLEKAPNDVIVTTINFNTDDIKTTIPVFALQQIPIYRRQPQEKILS